MFWMMITTPMKRMRLLMNVNMKKLSVNVGNFAFLLKQWLLGTLQSFHKKNMIMSKLNMEKLLTILKFQTVIIQYLVLGMNTTLINLLTQNTLNIKTV